VSDIERGGRMPTMGVSSSGPPANEGAKPTAAAVRGVRRAAGASRAIVPGERRVSCGSCTLHPRRSTAHMPLVQEGALARSSVRPAGA
jgi:hypothetical protein